jgi:hypothetical protein
MTNEEKQKKKEQLLREIYLELKSNSPQTSNQGKA